jgi:menaquinone-dependent protoporphyrinogen oxidase
MSHRWWRIGPVRIIRSESEGAMKAAVFYATRQGQARRVAERVAADLRARQTGVDVFDVRTLPPRINWMPYEFACVIASVHAGRHEREMVRFVTRYRNELQRVGAVFLSLTLSEAGAEDPAKPRELREQSRADVQRMIDVFVAETGWRPDRILPVAGALAYSKYNLFIRFVMKRIARKAGAPTDTSRDYEFTDWAAIDRFVAESVAHPPEPGLL